MLLLMLQLRFIQHLPECWIFVKAYGMPSRVFASGVRAHDEGLCLL